MRIECTISWGEWGKWSGGFHYHNITPVMFGPGRVEHRLHSSSRVLVNLQELDPGASRDVLAAYLWVTSGQGSEGTVGLSVNWSKIDLGSTRGILGVYILGLGVHRPSCVRWWLLWEVSRELLCLAQVGSNIDSIAHLGFLWTRRSWILEHLGMSWWHTCE